MAAFMKGSEIVKLAEQHGWINSGPGSKHPYILKKPGSRRNVPVRDKLPNRFEAQDILKELGIPRAEWPEKLK